MRQVEVSCSWEGKRLDAGQNWSRKRDVRFSMEQGKKEARVEDRGGRVRTRSENGRKAWKEAGSVLTEKDVAVIWG